MKKLLLLAALGFFSIAAFSQKNNMSQYAGVFKFTDAPFDKVSVKLSDGGILVASAEGVGEGEITSTDEADVFNEPENGAEMKYIRDENGRIVKMQISASGMYWEGVKEMVDFKDFVGAYTMDEGSSLDQVSIVLVDGILGINTSMGNASLAPSDEKDVFFIQEIDGKIGFQRGEDGKVNKISVLAMGQLLEGKRK